jgi:thiamine biosynthesis lipoprotein
MLRVVVKRSIEISRETGGVFDITVEPLVQAWGFGAERITQLPSAAAIKSMLHCVGTGKIRLSKDGLFKSQPGVHIDVNGIAQGYSVDLLADFLEKKRIENYLVEVGGEIRVKGRKQPSGEKMSIGIESPSGNDADPFPIRKILRLDHGAVTTSGNYHKYYMMGSKKISHLIDPKTGYPLQNEMISVTVLAGDAITADGYDNALMGLGLEKAMRFVEGKKNMEAYFIYHKADGVVTDTATAGFYKWTDK